MRRRSEKNADGLRRRRDTPKSTSHRKKEAAPVQVPLVPLVPLVSVIPKVPEVVSSPPRRRRRGALVRAAAGSAGATLRRLHAATLFTLHVLLAGFILCKSAAPIKELFSSAPWLAYYDDYFFVNAQGVFGGAVQAEFSLPIA